MPGDFIISIDSIPVMYAAGREGAPIAEQAPEAFVRLESNLSSLKGRKLYGVIIGDEYRACVAIGPLAEPSSLPYPTWKIPGGSYARRRIPDWEENLQLIGPTFEALCKRSDFDSSRPLVEYYRSRKELLLMAPVA